MKSFLSTLVLSSAISIIFTSCSSISRINISDGNSLNNTNWVVKNAEIKGLNKINKKLTLNFNDEKINGNLGCNNFFGKYKTNENYIELTQVGSTMIMCQSMDIEREYSKILNIAKKYKIENNMLYLYDYNNELIITFNRN